MVLFGMYSYHNRSLSTEKAKHSEITESIARNSKQTIEQKIPLEVKPVSTKNVTKSTASPIPEIKRISKTALIPKTTPISKAPLKVTIKATAIPSIKMMPSKKVTPAIKSVLTPVPVQPKLLIEKIKGKGNAGQAIVVAASGFGKVSATIETFEKFNGKWKHVSSISGNIGRNGFAYNKKEGDGHSPVGIFSLGSAFGKYSNPGTAKVYRKSTPNDFWVDDSNSSLYNTWQVGPVNGRWTSAESMYIAAYNYGFVINYNTSKRTPGKGSAIFFHVWSGAGHGTAGCIATSQANVISILKWLKPSKNPLIIEGPMSEILKM